VLADKLQIAYLNVPNVDTTTLSIGFWNFAQQFLQIFGVKHSRILEDPSICKSIVALLVFARRLVYTIVGIKTLSKSLEVSGNWQSFETFKDLCIRVILHHHSHLFLVVFLRNGRLLH